MTYDVLIKCKEWAIRQEFHKQSEAAQLKKIAEELTEAFIHQSLDMSVDDDIGDILISVNTLLVIQNFKSMTVDQAIKKYSEALNHEFAEPLSFGGNERVKLEKDEWAGQYVLVMAQLYRQSCPMAMLIELVMQLVFYYVDKPGRLINEYIEDSYNEIKSRRYKNQFVKD